MDMDLRKYARVYDHFLEESFCNKTITALKKIDWLKHDYYSEHSQSSVSFENDLNVAYSDTEEANIIQERLWDLIHHYIGVDNKELNGWYNAWNGYSKIRFNKYSKNNEMRTHCDHITTLFDGQIRGVPVLSIVGVLNDNYEGGDFLMWETEKIEMKTGSVIVFPSNFLYPHQVTPIVKGIRYSYVSWVW
jgi:predicted 2-oxoglutarate/Fe(II)-dependent dioxygenase YbiX